MTATITVYFVWKAHNTCPLWHYFQSLLHGLKTLPILAVLGTMCSVISRSTSFETSTCSERTDWYRVLIAESTLRPRAVSYQDWCSGHKENAKSFTWIDPVTVTSWSEAKPSDLIHNDIALGPRVRSKCLSVLREKNLDSIDVFEFSVLLFPLSR